jgi:hypothetical protein
MRSFPCVAQAVAILGLSLLLLAPGAPAVQADEAKPAAPAPCPCAGLAQREPPLDENDEIAALEAIRVALSEVGDGATYVWHRQHGRLSGMVQPTASFKDAAGRICRHILLILTTGRQTGKVEGIACRLANGRWQLDG